MTSPQAARKTHTNGVQSGQRTLDAAVAVAVAVAGERGYTGTSIAAVRAQLRDLADGHRSGGPGRLDAGRSLVRVTATVAYGARALTGAPDLSGLGLILPPVRPEE
ncbi:hypothetical protein ACFZB4_07010 [Streptomyces pseudovenezuelae]|uniref:hypothetical protein n=1 Tax=Streptomyces pseudovenezuelae TaxID=67350 RepID=UPI0036EBFC10